MFLADTLAIEASLCGLGGEQASPAAYSTVQAATERSVLEQSTRKHRRKTRGHFFLNIATFQTNSQGKKPFQPHHQHQTSTMVVVSGASLFYYLVLFGCILTGVAQFNNKSLRGNSLRSRKLATTSGIDYSTDGPIPCVGGKAGLYDCANMNLLSNRAAKDEQGNLESSNSIWGWTDSSDGDHEYVLLGQRSGVTVFDIIDPTRPIRLAFIRTTTHNSFWRDLKVYKDFAFIISEAYDHGMQIVDLTQLRQIDRGSPELPISLKVTERYTGFGNCHELSINEDTGMAFASGTRTCNSGLHIVNINDPLNPSFAGCVGEDGYVVGTECVIFHGSNETYQGQEVCFGGGEETLSIFAIDLIENPP